MTTISLKINHFLIKITINDPKLITRHADMLVSGFLCEIHNF